MKSKNEEWTSTMMAPIAAGNARVKWMKSAFHQDPKVKSWRITMEFDASGDLLKYWESSLDRAGNELTGGGISREIQALTAFRCSNRRAPSGRRSQAGSLIHGLVV